MPPEHPARDMQDTLYLDGEVPGVGRPATLLRTHTSPMQIRYMESHEPPVRIIVPGKVYRRDDLDLTHTPMFQQIEGLVVGEAITMADLKGTLTSFLHELFENRTRCCFGRVSSPTPSRAPRCSSAACSAMRRAARFANERDGSRSSEAAWCTRRVRSSRLRLRALHRLRVRRRHRARGDAEIRRRGHSSVLRERSALPGAVPTVKIVVSWLREFVDVTAPPEELGQTLSMRGFELGSVKDRRWTMDDRRSTMPSSTSKSPRTGRTRSA